MPQSINFGQHPLLIIGQQKELCQFRNDGMIYSDSYFETAIVRIRETSGQADWIHRTGMDLRSVGICRNLGWVVGVEPTTSRATVWRSATELYPPCRENSILHDSLNCGEKRARMNSGGGAHGSFSATYNLKRPLYKERLLRLSPFFRCHPLDRHITPDG